MAPQREWFEKDYYAILGVSETATAKEIKSAYRKLSRKYHPDANAGDAASEERFKEISAAYDVIGDDERRKEYDEVRRLGPVGGGFGGGGPGGGFSFTTDNLGDLGDLFGNLFNRGRGRGRGRDGSTVGPAARRGSRDRAAAVVRGSGARRHHHGEPHQRRRVPHVPRHRCQAGHDAEAVPALRRPRDHRRQPGLLLVQPAVPAVWRHAVCIVEEPCPTCHGSGTELRARQVKVRIPAGVQDGQRIRLKGRGGPGRNGGPNGDLYVVAKVEPHPLFGRRDNDLTITVPVTFAEAALGAEVKVPTLDGSPVTIKVPAGTRSGRTFRVKGRGVPSSKRAGDLLVTVEVAVPAKLTSEERKAVEASGRGVHASRRAPIWGCSAWLANAIVPSTSSRWPPSSPACIRRRCASTSARVSSTRPAPAAAAVATATTTSIERAASKS